ncbi:MAG: hypothetical protein WCJ35_16500 [Planctomycetota bacterium]
MSTSSATQTLADESPLVAAWDAGRLLNRLRFHLIQAWLAGDRGQSALAIEQFVALVPVLRRAVVSAEASDALITDIDRERDNWVASFDSVAQRDELVSANAAFAVMAESSQSEGAVAEQVLGDALASIRGIYATVRGAINSAMDHRHRQAFAAGEMVDGAIRPPTVYREMPRGSLAHPLGPGRIDAATSEGPASTPSAWIMHHRGDAHRWYLPTGCMEHTSKRPGERWFQDLAEFWKVLKLHGEPPSGSNLRPRTSLERLVDAIDQRVRNALLRHGVVPQWDADSGELRIGTTIVRKVALRASNLLPVLSCFQEDGWPQRIDSPIEDNSQTLHATIRTLNKGLALIRFRADGAGEGIIWAWQDTP